MGRSFRRIAILGTMTFAWCLLAAQAAAAQWSLQSIPSPPGGGELYGVSCPSGSSCIAVGRRFSPNGVGPIGLVETWNGTQWTFELVPKPSGTQLNGVSCVSSASCTAVGYNVDNGLALVESWNGTAWKPVPNPERTDHAQLLGVSCASKTSCTAVGFYLKPGHGNHALVEHWDGRSWKLQSVAVSAARHQSQLDGVTCVSRSSCIAVGSDGSQRPPLIERWNGTSWAVQSNGNSPDHFLDGVSCAAGASCIAVGRSKLGHLKGPFAESWDGNNWSIDPSASPSQTTGALNAVSCVSSSACTAVGNGPMAERWDGSSWSIQTLPALGTSSAGLFGVSCPSRSLCIAVGGYFANGSNAYYKPLAEMWRQ